MDGRIWMPCPHPICVRPRTGLVPPSLDSDVAVPTRGVNDSTIAGSPRGSSVIAAEVNVAVQQ
jgi:hypothetical protein